MTKAEAEQAARDEYAVHVGQIINVQAINGYVGDTDVSVERRCDPPLAVRVLDTGRDDLCRWIDDWLDPIWNVEPVDASDLRSCWVYATSYHPVSGQRDAGDRVDA